MTKVYSAADFAQLVLTQAQRDALERLVAPTADDLLILTEEALRDVDPVLNLAPEQRDALRLALARRLGGAMLDARSDPAASTDG